MNASQRFGLFLLIAISIAYVYFSFFGNNFKFNEFNNKQEDTSTYNPLDNSIKEPSPESKPQILERKNIKIFLLDKSGNMRSVYRTCDTAIENSCFAFAIQELINAPSKWEKSKGFTSEIPVGTKVLSVRESSNSIQIDLSSNFEAGGGAESTYTRIKQIIKTANANTNIPTYLYVNGRQANVIGGEGIMIKQPLNERSFDE